MTNGMTNGNTQSNRHDRRQGDQHLAVLNTIIQQLADVHIKLERLSSLEPNLNRHIAEEEVFQNELRAMATKAFPNGDLVLHRMEHEAARERAKLCKEFWQSLLAKLGEKSVFAILAVAGAIIWYWWNGHMHVPGVK